MNKPVMPSEPPLDPEEVFAQEAAASLQGRPAEFLAMQVAYLEEAVRDRDRRIKELEERLAEVEATFEEHRQRHRPA